MRWSHLCVPAYLLLTLLLTWPLAREFGRSLPTVVGFPDTLLQAWILSWDLEALSKHPAGVFDAPIFHPERNTLTYMDHLLGEAVVAVPVAAVTRNRAAAYNSVVFFSFVASAWAMYRLVRLLGMSAGAAFLCGLWFAFSPYRYAQMVNLNLLQTQFLPLGLFFAIRFVRGKRRRDVVGAGVSLAVQSYFSWYYTFYLAIALLVLWIYEIARGRVRWRELLERRVLAAAAVTGLLILPGLYPYLKQRLSMPGFQRTLTAYWSADLFDYLKTNVENRLLGRIPWLTSDRPYFPGLVTAFFSVLALVRRLGDGGYFVVLGAVGLVLSLGPILHVAGQRVPLPLPYAVLHYVVPGFSSMRAAGRFAVLALIAAVVLAGFGYEWCRRRGIKALFPVALAASLALTLSIPLPTVAFPERRSMPPIYEWLARQEGALPVLDLPVPAREQDEGTREIVRQVYSLYHGKPLVDGVSGFVPPSHVAFRTVMQTFPEPEAIRAAAARGTRIVIVHYDDYEPLARERLRRTVERATELRQVARYENDVAYALDPRSR